MKESYAGKFNAMMFILNRLNQGEFVTKTSLMEDLQEYVNPGNPDAHASERTVYRYIKALRDTGFGIEFDRKRKTYSFPEGYGLSKPELSISEQLALGLSKQMFRSSGIDRELTAVEGKLCAKGSLPLKHMVVKAPDFRTEGSKYLDAISTAIPQYKVLKLSYSNLWDNRKTERDVEPHYLFYSAEDLSWHLRARCRLRHEMRTFSLDRINQLTVLDEQYAPINIATPDELNMSFGTWLDDKPVNVTLRFNSQIKQHILRKQWHSSQENRELKDGSLEVKFKVIGTEEIRAWIIRWVPHVKVVKPKSLRESILADLKKAVDEI